jgi:hypothetical protein
MTLYVVLGLRVVVFFEWDCADVAEGLMSTCADFCHVIWQCARRFPFASLPIYVSEGGIYIVCGMMTF